MFDGFFSGFVACSKEEPGINEEPEDDASDTDSNGRCIRGRLKLDSLFYIKALDEI